MSLCILCCLPHGSESVQHWLARDVPASDTFFWFIICTLLHDGKRSSVFTGFGLLLGWKNLSHLWLHLIKLFHCFIIRVRRLPRHWYVTLSSYFASTAYNISIKRMSMLSIRPQFYLWKCWFGFGWNFVGTGTLQEILHSQFNFD
jgi:hypothetical protein